MSLEIWKQNKRIRPVASAPQDVRNQLEAARHDLQQAEAVDLSSAWRLAIAYEAARKFAVAALAAAGYRVTAGAGHHYYALQSLRYTVGVDPRLVRLLDAFREKRNDITYDHFTPPGDKEATEMLALARDIGEKVADWLRREHPEMTAV
jgi:hypothetical protein